MEGLFPINFAPLCEKVVSLYDYDAEAPSELSLKKGEVVWVLEKSADGWWRYVFVAVVFCGCGGGCGSCVIVIAFFVVMLWFRGFCGCCLNGE